jgi:uncharacterized protein YceK
MTMKTVIVAIVVGALLSGCSDTTTSATSTSPSGEMSTSSPTVNSSEGWSPELEERAATIYANGIKNKYPLELRMAAGRCAVARLKRFYDTYDEWLAAEKNPESFDVLARHLKALGKCETKVGI